MKKKINSYLGLARRARKLIAGYNTCVLAVERKQAKLVILGDDLSENTKNKFRNLCKKSNIPFRIYSTAEELSNASGNEGKGVYAVIDQNFANVIKKEIDDE